MKRGKKIGAQTESSGKERNARVTAGGKGHGKQRYEESAWVYGVQKVHACKRCMLAGMAIRCMHA